MKLHENQYSAAHLIGYKGWGTVVKGVKLFRFDFLQSAFAGEQLNDFGVPGFHECVLDSLTLHSHFVLQTLTVYKPCGPLKQVLSIGGVV